MKKIINYLIIVIILTLFIPVVKAEKVTETYTNYYFFLESYNKSTPETTNYTAFPPLDGTNILYSEATKIELKKRDCEENEETNNECCDTKDKKDDICWTYSKFYEEYKSVLNYGVDSKEYEVGEVKHKAKIRKKGNNTYFTHGMYSPDGKEWLEPGEISKIDNNYSCASIYPEHMEMRPVNSNFDIITEETAASSGINIAIKRYFGTEFQNINWDGIDNHISECPDNVIAINKKVYSPAVYKYEYTTTEYKCDVSEPQNKELSCNNNLTLNSGCDRLTVSKDSASADVEINQKGMLSSLLTPNNLFAGGGFKFGLIYTNEISWNYVESNPNAEIEEAMKNKLKTLTDFENNINLSNVNFNGKTIDASLFEKKCYQTGEFTAGKTLTTVCTFFLPKSEMDEYTGKVTYGVGIDKGINNKYYTALTDNGNYKIEASIENMSIIKDDTAKSDGVGGKNWTGNWNVTLKDCNINIYSLISGKIKFIYRPIDIKNPFPSRNPGINWYEWYSNYSNKERLEKTYSNLNYTVSIDNTMLAKIKEYNEGTNYFDFDTMENDKSTFLKNYFPNAKVGDRK